MHLYWLRVIGPKSGKVFLTEYYYSRENCILEAEMWLFEGMAVETWFNYRAYGV